jgi:hypothetical protein
MYSFENLSPRTSDLSPRFSMKKIDIAAILSPDLKSRMRAQDLKALIENSGADAVEMDF